MWAKRDSPTRASLREPLPDTLAAALTSRSRSSSGLGSGVSLAAKAELDRLPAGVWLVSSLATPADRVAERSFVRLGRPREERASGGSGPEFVREVREHLASALGNEDEIF